MIATKSSFFDILRFEEDVLNIIIRTDATMNETIIISSAMAI